MSREPSGVSHQTLQRRLGGDSRRLPREVLSAAPTGTHRGGRPGGVPPKAGADWSSSRAGRRATRPPELPRLRQPADAAARERRGEAGAGRGRGKGPDRAAGKDEGTGCGRTRRGEVAHRPDARVRVGPEEPADAGGPTVRGGGWGHKRQESARSYLRRGSWPVRGGEGEAEGETGSAARRREGDGHGSSGPPDASLYPGDRSGRGRRRRAPPGRLLGAARERGREARDAPPSLLLFQALQVPAPRTPSRPSTPHPLPAALPPPPAPGLLRGLPPLPSPPPLRSPQLPPGVRSSRRRASEARVLCARELCSAFQRNCLITD